MTKHFIKLKRVLIKIFLFLFRLLACGVLTLTISGGSHGKLTGEKSVQFVSPPRATPRAIDM